MASTAVYSNPSKHPEQTSKRTNDSPPMYLSTPAANKAFFRFASPPAYEDYQYKILAEKCNAEQRRITSFNQRHLVLLRRWLAAGYCTMCSPRWLMSWIAEYYSFRDDRVKTILDTEHEMDQFYARYLAAGTAFNEAMPEMLHRLRVWKCDVDTVRREARQQLGPFQDELWHVFFRACGQDFVMDLHPADGEKLTRALMLRERSAIISWWNEFTDRPGFWGWIQFHRREHGRRRGVGMLCTCHLLWS